MIESIEKIVIVQAKDLPDIFTIAIGDERHTLTYSHEDSHSVYLDTDHGVRLWLRKNEEIAILIPDSLDNPVTYAEMMLELSDLGASI